jgi:hypothetical protein
MCWLLHQPPRALKPAASPHRGAWLVTVLRLVARFIIAGALLGEAEIEVKR